ncbi:MAG: hypothetical protein HY823_05485 [Acidobacteria bacterium]|nr:hypothetical protein [Acidobacteriota bacterium]
MGIRISFFRDHRGGWPRAGSALLLLGLLTFSLSCGGGSGPSGGPAAADSLTQQSESAHFVYHWAPGDGVDAAWQEGYYPWLAAALQVEAPAKLQYFKYRDRAHMRAITGRDSNGWADISGNLAFHTIWPTDNHECVHALVTRTMGLAPSLLGEGIAVAHSVDLAKGWGEPQWKGEPVHAIAARFRRQGTLPPLGGLVESIAFSQYDANTTYPLAGSFVRFLIDTRGLAPLKTYFRSSTFMDSGATTRLGFQQAFGIPLDQAWNEWLAFLDAQP